MTRSSADLSVYSQAADICAAIDLGTVTSRLLVARVDAGDTGPSANKKVRNIEPLAYKKAISIEPLARKTIITHMGENLAQTGRISDLALERVVKAVHEFKEIIVEVRDEFDQGDVKVRAVATSAMRDASNSAEVIRQLDEQGLKVEIITGEQEAELSFLGTLSGFPLERPIKSRTVVTIDVGGGSTEIIIGEQGFDLSGSQKLLIKQAISFDIGSRRVTDLYLHEDPPAEHEMRRARDWIVTQTASFFRSFDEKPEMVLAVAGVPTTVVSMLKMMKVYNPELVHGTVVSLQELDTVMNKIESVPLRVRRELVGLNPERASVIVGGCLVFRCMLEELGVESFVVSETDILQGILLS